MKTDLLTESRSPLACSVERVVRSRTGGTIRDLQVEISGGTVILSGRTNTYYTKQLATHAALDAIDDASLANMIEVL